jgi:hypothetical protein
MRAMPIVGILFLSFLTGCAGVPSLAPTAPPQAPASPAAAIAPPPSEQAAPQSPAAASAPPQAATVAPVPAPPNAAPPVAPAPSPSIARAPSPKVPAPAKAPAPTAPVPKTDSTTPDTTKPKAPPLDLTSLEQRLKSTNAIGVLTKLTLKNQVDDLLDQFRAYYQGKLKTTLADLRRSYDLLVQKVLSLLQDSDPPLATDIVASRDAIWGILSDPKKFATI